MFLSWLTVLLSHKTIAVSKSIARDAHAFPFVKRKIIMIQSGIEPPTFFSREEARRALLEHIGTPIPKHMFWIGTVAEIHPNKGLSYAILAMQTIPNALYIIIGDGEERNRLKNLVRAKGLAERVFLPVIWIMRRGSFVRLIYFFSLPSQKRSGMRSLRQDSRDFLLSQHNVGGIPEIIKNGETGILVPPKNRVQSPTRSPLLCTTKKSGRIWHRSFIRYKK